MAFIYMSNGTVFRVPGTREAVAVGISDAADGRLWETEAEGFQGGNPDLKVSINPAQIVAIVDQPLIPRS